MSEFEKGQLVEVCDYAEFPPERTLRREFVVKDRDVYYTRARSRASSLTPWTYARAIPEPEPVPYYYDTFPRGIVWLRHAWRRVVEGGSVQCIPAIKPEPMLVTRVGRESITAGNRNVKYHLLVDEWEMSVDNGQTWQPAHRGTLK